jgi:hypothetical protein
MTNPTSNPVVVPIELYRQAQRRIYELERQLILVTRKETACESAESIARPADRPAAAASAQS